MSESPTFSPDRRKIAVLGAGISGLSAAYRLSRLRPDWKIDLYDRNYQVGGVLQTEQIDGFQIEQSADNFITTVPWGVDLCKELGLGGELVQTNPMIRRTYVVRKGRLHLLPDGFLMLAPTKLWPMVITPLLSPIGKLRAGLELLIPSRKDDRDETMSRFVRRRLGKEVFERLVEPLVSGVYAADMEKLSVLATLSRFRELEKNHGSLIWAMQRQLRSNRAAHLSEQSGARYSMFITLKKGLSHLCETLARRLDPETLQLESRIEKLEFVPSFPELSGAPRKWNVSGIRNSTPFTESYEAVICALPSHESARLLLETFPDLARRLGKIEHQGTAIATLAFHRDQLKQPVRGMGFVVPKIEKSPILAGSFSSLKYPHRAPGDKLLIRLFAGGARAPEMAEMPREQLVPQLVKEMRKILKIEGEPLFCSVAHWPRTMPQYHLGHLELVEEIERELEDIPHLALAGNAFHGVGIPNCSHSGQKAAEKIAASLGE